MAAPPSEPTSPWWTAEQASAHLGVTRQTLYTYVSRGWVRRRKAGGRRKLYLAADIHELAVRAAEAKGQRAAAGAALRWGPPVLASQLTAIDPDGPYYRGRSALAFAEEGASFEEVVAHLWARPPELGARPPATAAPTTSVDTGLPGHLLSSVLAAGAGPLPPLALVWAMVRGVAWWAGGDERARAALDHSCVADGLATALGADRPVALDLPLVLCLDHELNASTFAGRVAASTGATDAFGLLAALATWCGPRHGLASEALEDALDASSPAERPAASPGFGHPLYPLGDPRAELLFTASGGPPAWADRRPPPNLDAGLVAWRRAHHLPRGTAAAVFAVGRSAGWLAHLAEQRTSGELLRPRAHYAGPPLVG